MELGASSDIASRRKYVAHPPGKHCVCFVFFVCLSLIAFQVGSNFIRCVCVFTLLCITRYPTLQASSRALLRPRSVGRRTYLVF